jgi:hypothetical protein
MQRSKAKLALAYIEQKYANLRTENLERAESQKRADILELKMEEMGINEHDKGRYYLLFIQTQAFLVLLLHDNIKVS